MCDEKCSADTNIMLDKMSRTALHWQRSTQNSLVTHGHYGPCSKSDRHTIFTTSYFVYPINTGKIMLIWNQFLQHFCLVYSIHFAFMIGTFIHLTFTNKFAWAQSKVSSCVVLLSTHGCRRVKWLHLQCYHDIFHKCMFCNFYMKHYKHAE